MGVYIYIRTYILSTILFYIGSRYEVEAVKEVSAKYLVSLNEYVNQWPGFLHDHITTTWTYSTHPKTLNSYYQLSVLGMVLKSDGAKECDCAVEVLQIVDEFMGIGGGPGRPGLLGKLNHKLQRAENNILQIYGNYLQTGERFYCVSTKGECGATVPLREVESEIEYDTLYNTNENQTIELGLVDKGVICYIWDKNYHNVDSKRYDQKDDGKNTEDRHITPIPNYNDKVENGEYILNGLKAFPGTSATLICLPNYTPSNSTVTSICQSSSQWIPPPIYCKKRDCKAFTEAHYNGKVQYNIPIVALTPVDENEYLIGTKARLECSDGLGTGGADMSVCTEQGWIPNVLSSCTKVCSNFALNHGNVRYTDAQGYTRTVYSNGTVATAICNPGTRLQGVGTANCVNGEWSTVHIGSCEPIQCLRLEPAKKGAIEYSNPHEAKQFTVGSMATLTCNNGSQLKGASETVCDSDGVWKPKIGTCD